MALIQQLQFMTSAEGLRRLVWPVLGIYGVALLLPWLRADGLLLASGQVAGSDFVVFYAAATQALAGEGLSAYDVLAFKQVQMGVIGDSGYNLNYPFVYPPALLALLAPLGYLPYWLAYLVWNMLGLGLFASACYRLLPHRLTVPVVCCLPQMLVCLLHGQTGLLMAGLLGWMLVGLIDKRYWLAGLALGLATLKPQLALCFGLPLLAGRYWAALAGAMIGAALLHGLGWLVYGRAGIEAFWQAGQAYSQVFDHAALQFDKMPNLLGLVGTITEQGLGQKARSIAMGGVVALGVLCISIVRITRKHKAGAARQGSGADAASPDAAQRYMIYIICLIFGLLWLAIPYLYHYDLPIMALPVLALLRLRQEQAQTLPDWLGPALLGISLFTALAMGLAVNVPHMPNIAVLGAVGLLICLYKLAPIGEHAAEQPVQEQDTP